MKTKAKYYIRVSVLSLFLAVGFMTIVPTVASATTPKTVAECNSGGGFLTFKPWYNGLATTDGNGGCVISSPSGDKSSLQNFIWHIVLNILAILIQIVGYLAVIMIIFGGFQFLTGGDNPAQVTKARTTILNAVIGLVISISATAVINLIVTNLLGNAASDSTTLLPNQTADQLWAGILKLIYYVAGAVAIIMMILAGFRYITANGDPNAIKKAKNQILYGVVGLIIIMVAFAITDFVLGRIKG